MRHALGRRTALALLLMAGVAGCGSAPADPATGPPVLVTQPDFRPGGKASCLMHQTEQPNAAYQGGPDAQPTPQLTFLAYYTAAGRRPFCDGQPATATDKAWAEVYVRLTGNAANVSTVLG
jgi:hypothetical protein